jgi:hypothetical protein
MNEARWVMLLTIGMLLSAAGYADDTKLSNAHGESLPGETRSIEALLAESVYASRWQLYHPLDAIAYSDDWKQPIADINFRDGSTLARVSKLRNLSLLTLAEVGQTRLFLGVNDDGLVGLHFNLFSRADDTYYLEAVRMPYLKKSIESDPIESMEVGPVSTAGRN